MRMCDTVDILSHFDRQEFVCAPIRFVPEQVIFIVHTQNCSEYTKKRFLFYDPFTKLNSFLMILKQDNSSYCHENTILYPLKHGHVILSSLNF